MENPSTTHYDIREYLSDQAMILSDVIPDNPNLLQADDELEEFGIEGSAATTGPEPIAPLTSKYINYADIGSDLDGDIDTKLTPVDLMTIIRAEIFHKKIAGHHIDSMNTFNQVGIKQIATQSFHDSIKVDGMKNQRNKTEEDRAIDSISYSVRFTDVRMAPPSTLNYNSGLSQIQTPQNARIRNATYSAPAFIDADIVATALYHDGHVVTRKAELRNHRCTNLPCLVGSDICTTHNQSKESLKALHEDPEDDGGYFIIKGGEWVVDNLENLCNNSFHVYKNVYANEIARGTFISKPGDAFENSRQTILRYLANGGITIEVTLNKNEKLDVPFYLIFRALGMTNDRDILNHIVYGIDNTDQVTRTMVQLLSKALDVEDKNFAPISKNRYSQEIINFIAMKLKEPANPNAVKKDDNALKYYNTRVFLNVIDQMFLPHIGDDPKMRIQKLRFIGHLINKLLSVHMGIIESTDRDSYRNKRVDSAGRALAKSFKTYLNFTIVQDIRTAMNKAFIGNEFKEVNLLETVQSAIKGDTLERLMIQSITSGNKVIHVKRNNDVQNRLSSGILYRKNDLNVKNALNTVNTPGTSAKQKQNERADEMRRVHPTYLGFIDVTQSAESGDKVGMSKHLAATASICGASSSFVLRKVLMEDPGIIPLDNVSPESISHNKLGKVFVNGHWLGCCTDTPNLTARYRHKRRTGEIHHFTSVVWDPRQRDVYFWVDVGRVLRPIIIVYNNLRTYVERVRAGDKDFKFKQWIKLTAKHIHDLQTHRITMDDLRHERIIEYIAPDEQESALIAMNIDVLRENQHNVCMKFTHMGIDQDICSIMTLTAPMGNHSGATRNTYYTCHRKQACGWPMLNYQYRMDKNIILQHYCERPLISTFSCMLTHPNGQNCIVAYMLNGGRNQEDSLIINQTSVDCGMFNASFYGCEKTELDKGEQFGNPEFSGRTMDIKRNASYESIHDGKFVAVGTLIRKGTVLAVKCAKLGKAQGDYLYADKSLIYKKDEPVRVERVVTTRNDDDIMIAKVKWRANRPIKVGDKLSSRTGNKGIVGESRRRCDMPYSETGLVPDIITSPHSIPTRLAINQLIETAIALLAAKQGNFIDATTLKSMDLDKVISLLEGFGIKYGGAQRLYDGITGEWYDTLILIGPTCYQRLQKFVIDEKYAVMAGPSSATTHQPIEGKNNDGGLKIGEMEKDVICAHGAMRALFEKFSTDSDGMTMYICRNCKNRAIVNEQIGLYKCKHCDNNADIASVESTWVANLLMNNLSSANIKMSFELDPHEYPKYS